MLVTVLALLLKEQAVSSSKGLGEQNALGGAIDSQELEQLRTCRPGLVIPSTAEKAGWNRINPLEAPPTIARQPEGCLALLR